MAPDKPRVLAPKSSRTCDICRQRKIKCVTYADDTSRPCEGCTKLHVDCTFNYVKKKPGRKNSFSPRGAGPNAPSSTSAEVYKQPQVSRASTSSSSTSASTSTTTTGSSANTSLAGQQTRRASPIAANIVASHLSQQSPIAPSSSHNNSTLAFSYPSSSSAFLGAPPLPSYETADTGSTATHLPSDHVSHHANHPHHRRDPSTSTTTTTPTTAITRGSGPTTAAANSSSSDVFSGLSGTGQSSLNLPSLEEPSILPKTEAGQPSSSTNDPSNLSWLDSILEGASSWGSTTNILGDVPEATMSIFSSDAAFAESQSPNFSLASTSSAPEGTTGISALLHAPQYAKIGGERQLEDVTTWANISHFISLYLQHLYPLLPLVHRPKFAEHMAMRRDLRDPDFRALLLSIVAFVISQVPTTRLVSDQFDIESLKRLQRQCYRTCRNLQRTSHSPTSLTQVNTLIFETFYLLSVGLGHIAGSRLGQAIQLAFSMGLNSDAKTEALGLDTIEIQLRRRTFWQLYATDKTRAISGLPMLINDFQGVCSLPEPIDDEFITSQGYFYQPQGQVSVMVGFVAVSRVFRILSEVFFHHRCLTTGFKNVPIEWTTATEHQLHQILNELPNEIMDPLINSTEAARQVFAMQRANILITIACCKFALYDLRAALNDNEAQLKIEKEGIAREMHSLLMGIPVEDLASNGESVRAKVFHIVTALCTQVPATDLNYDLVRDWCNMFFAISFVQMPAPPPENLGIDSRAPTPPVE
ncbi:hypothetical protein P389DRAFT_62398 [Cystobasidium minutum MCA 4210]|uniref:uncharacterized protein n=1 Tax=Cystobasidium minutum MCA 4210 TaxID=1397322 RepID=UPI0034CFE895|eukprot:jgi/Rhomi1/62398/CE62397_654